MSGQRTGRNEHGSYGHTRYHGNRHMHPHHWRVATEHTAVTATGSRTCGNIGSVPRLQPSQHEQHLRSTVSSTIHPWVTGSAGMPASTRITGESLRRSPWSLQPYFRGRLSRLCTHATAIATGFGIGSPTVVARGFFYCYYPCPSIRLICVHPSLSSQGWVPCTLGTSLRPVGWLAAAGVIATAGPLSCLPSFLAGE